MGKYSVLDLFSGAGGFSLGAQLAGLEVVGSIELDRFASETYRANFPRIPHFERNILECSQNWLRTHFLGVNIVLGGPPCQGFSVAGPSQYGQTDFRNDLLLEMARVVGTLKPKFVVLENVRGILSGKLSRGSRALNSYIDDLSRAGYDSRIYDLNAADFGTPQIRRRIFVLSTTSGTLLPAKFRGEYGQKQRPWVTSLEALSDLPSPAPGEGHSESARYLRATNPYQRNMRKGSNAVLNHIAMKHTPRILARLATICAGQSMRDVQSEYGQRKRNSSLLDAGQRYKMNCTRINPQSPSIALPANFQTIHVHPIEHRMLTAREGARIQGFPDKFIFKGPRTLMSKKLLIRENRQDEIGLSQYNQIGNAVPPLLAQAVLREL